MNIVKYLKAEFRGRLFIVVVRHHDAKGKVSQHMVTFEVLTVTSMKMAVFWDVAPCSLVVNINTASIITVMNK
jgi:hypothetical protein